MQNFNRKLKHSTLEQVVTAQLQNMQSVVDTKDKVIHCQRNIIKSLHQRVKERDHKIITLHSMIEAMRQKLEELNVPLSSINFKKKQQTLQNSDQAPDGEVLYEPLDAAQAEKLYYEREGTPSQEDDKVNAIVRYQSGRLTPLQNEERKNSRESGVGFSPPERDFNYDSAYLSPYDQHVLESLDLGVPSSKKNVDMSLQYSRQEDNQKSRFAPKKSASKPVIQSKRKELKSEERKIERSPSRLENVTPHPLAISGTVNQSKVLKKFNPMNKSVNMSSTNIENFHRKTQLYSYNSTIKLPGIQDTQNLRKSSQKPITLKAINRYEKLKNAAATQQGYLQEAENNRYMEHILKVHSKMSKYVDIPLLKAVLVAHFAHSSSRMTFTSKLARWTKRVIFDILGTVMLTRDCANAINVQKTFPRVIEMLTELLEVERCAAFMYDEEDEQIYIRAISGMQLATNDLILKKEGIFDEIFQTPAGYIHVPCSELIEENKNYDASVIDAAVNSKTRNQLLVALREPTGKVIGFIEIANKKHGQEFSQLDLYLLKLISKSLAKGLAIYERGQLLNEKMEREMEQVNSLKSKNQDDFMMPFVNTYLSTLSYFLEPQSKQDIIEDRIYLFIKEGQFFYQFPDANTYSSEHLAEIPVTLGLLGAAYKSRRKIVEAPNIEALHENERKLVISNHSAVILIKNISEQEGIADSGLHLDQGDEILGALFVSLRRSLSNSQKRKLPHYANVLSKIIQKQHELNGIVLNQALLNGAFNCINEGLLWFNSRLTFTKINLAAAELLGKKPQEVVDKSVQEILGESNNYIKRKILQAVEANCTFEEELCLWSKGNERIPINVHLVTLSEDLESFLLIIQPVLARQK